jgi:hypothetical protein
MNKNLALLKQELFDVSHEGILKYLIPVLEDFERQIAVLEEYIYRTTPIGNDNQVGGVDNIIIRKGEN